MTIIASSTSQSDFRLFVLLRLLIVLAACAVWMMLPQWQGVALAQESASISGTVTDENGAPIEGIKVTAYRQVVDTESQMISWLPSGGSLATSEGIYNINVGQGGVFHIHFADTVFPPRYAPEYYVDSNAVWFGVDIVVNDRENFSGVDAMLLFGSSITGKVTDINGTPIENALVNAYRPIDNGGGYTSYEYAGEVTVGADGSYMLTVGFSGVVRLSFSDSRLSLPEHKGEYYNNIPDEIFIDEVWIADNITVTFGSVVENIDAQLDRLARITGIITSKGNPVSGLYVSAYEHVPYSDPSSELVWRPALMAGAITDDSGRYDIRLLNGGTYRICAGFEYNYSDFVPTCYGGPTVETARDVAAQLNYVVSDIDFNSGEFGKITGSVVDQAGNPVAGLEVSAFRYNEPYPQSVASGVTDKNGQYQITGLMPYIYKVRAYGGWFNLETKWHHEKYDFDSATEITIETDSEVGIDFTLRPRQAKLTVILDSNPNSRLNVEFSGSFGEFKLDDPIIDDRDSHTNVTTFIGTPDRYGINLVRLPEGRYITKVDCTSPSHQWSWDGMQKSFVIELLENEDVTCTFTVERGVNIRGMVYHDRNGNGARNRNEAWLPGWQTYVLRTDGMVRMEIPTNDVGRAEYNLLPPGQYTLCAVIQEGWSNSQPGKLDPTQQQPCYALDMPAVTGATMRFGMIHANSASYRGVPSESPDGVEIVLEDEEIDEEESSEEEVSTLNFVFLPVVTR